MSTNTHVDAIARADFPFPFAIVRDETIIGYAWTAEAAERSLASYACPSWLKGGHVYPNPCVGVTATLVPRLEA